MLLYLCDWTQTGIHLLVTEVQNRYREAQTSGRHSQPIAQYITDPRCHLHDGWKSSDALLVRPVFLLPKFKGNWQKRDKGFVEIEGLFPFGEDSFFSTVIPTPIHHEASEDVSKNKGQGGEECQ